MYDYAYSVLHFVIEWMQLIIFIALPEITWGSNIKATFSEYLSLCQLQYLVVRKKDYFTYQMLFIGIVLVMIATIVVFVLIQRESTRNKGFQSWLTTLFIRRIIM